MLLVNPLFQLTKDNRLLHLGIFFTWKQKSSVFGMLMSPGGKHMFSLMKQARAQLRSAESRSDRKMELLNPRYSPPAMRCILKRKKKAKERENDYKDQMAKQAVNMSTTRRKIQRHGCKKAYHYHIWQSIYSNDQRPNLEKNLWRISSMLLDFQFWNLP